MIHSAHYDSYRPRHPGRDDAGYPDASDEEVDEDNESDDNEEPDDESDGVDESDEEWSPLPRHLSFLNIPNLRFGGFL